MPPSTCRLHPWSGKPVKALLFDLDGTLVDSAPDIATAINTVLTSQGLEALDVSVVRSLIGEGIRRLTEKAFAVRGVALSGDALDSNTASFAANYATCIADQTVPFLGVVESLQHFKEAGFKLAVVSNKAQHLTEHLMSQIGLVKFFDHIQGAVSSLAPKPAPDMLLATLAQLGTAPQESLFIGDSSIDLAAGNAAGLPVVLLEGGYTAGSPLPKGAAHVTYGFHALARWIDGVDV